MRHAWLTSLSEEEALEAVTHQISVNRRSQGAHHLHVLPKMLQESGARGFSLLRGVHAVGSSAMTAPIGR